MTKEEETVEAKPHKYFSHHNSVQNGALSARQLPNNGFQSVNRWHWTGHPLFEECTEAGRHQAVAQVRLPHLPPHPLTSPTIQLGILTGGGGGSRRNWLSVSFSSPPAGSSVELLYICALSQHVTAEPVSCPALQCFPCTDSLVPCT